MTGGLTGTWETDGLTFLCTLEGVRYTGAMTEALDSKENAWVICFTALDETARQKSAAAGRAAGEQTTQNIRK